MTNSGATTIGMVAAIQAMRDATATHPPTTEGEQAPEEGKNSVSQNI